jgi:ADP-ribose pyrophosphatase YjhB (NUDIX family)
MISFQFDTHRFHLRAAAVVIHEQRLLVHRTTHDDYWSLPGGRVEAGELAADAIVREMREEIGEQVLCERLVAVVENFFTIDDRQQHEVGLYFAVRLPPASPRLSATRFIGVEGGDPLIFEWIAIEALDDVDFRPSAIRPLFKSPRGPLVHLVTRDGRA